MRNEISEQVYVCVYLVKHDAGTNFAAPDGLIEARALPFANLANASAAFEDAKKVLDDAALAGTHTLAERVKPGRRKAS
jgi:hypothetical protein